MTCKRIRRAVNKLIRFFFFFSFVLPDITSLNRTSDSEINTVPFSPSNIRPFLPRLGSIHFFASISCRHEFRRIRTNGFRGLNILLGISTGNEGIYDRKDTLCRKVRKLRKKKKMQKRPNPHYEWRRIRIYSVFGNGEFFEYLVLEFRILKELFSGIISFLKLEHILKPS